METLTASEIESAIGSLTPADVRYECENCDDTEFALDPETHRPNGLRCECAKERRAANLARWKVAEVDRLRKLISERVDIDKTTPRGYMAEIRDSKSLWLHGAAGNGKTHCAAWVIKRAIETADNPFQWGWYRIRKLADAWQNQYSEFGDVKFDALQILKRLESDEIVIIDDIDKIGTITAAREEEFFGLIDSIHERRAQLIITSQNDIDSFCDRMSREKMFIQRDGKGPQQRRLHEICRQIEVKEQRK